MNCRDIEPLLSAQRDGVLTDDQHAALDRHLEVCPACQQLRTRIEHAMAVFRSETANVAVPDADEEWQRLQSRLGGRSTAGKKQRQLAPVLWIGTSLAAAAAIAFAFISSRPVANPAVEPQAPASEIAQAEYVEPGDANASTMVYVDKDSGWLVVWATDTDATTKS